MESPSLRWALRRRPPRVVTWSPAERDARRADLRKFRVRDGARGPFTGLDLEKAVASVDTALKRKRNRDAKEQADDERQALKDEAEATGKKLRKRAPKRAPPPSGTQGGPRVPGDGRAPPTVRVFKVRRLEDAADVASRRAAWQRKRRRRRRCHAIERKKAAREAGAGTRPARRRAGGAPPAPRAASKHPPGSMCPWWRPDAKPLYDQAPVAAPDALSERSALRRAEGKDPAASWFSVRAVALPTASVGPVGPADGTAWREHMAFAPAEVWSQETGADRKEATAARGAPLGAKPLAQTRARKLRIRASAAQERMLRKWASAARLTYNAAVALVKRDRRWASAEGQYLKEALVIAARRAASANDKTGDAREAMDAVRAALGIEVGAFVAEHPWLLEVPSAIRNEACRAVVKAVTSNEAKKRTNPKHKWTLKLKQRKNASAWTMAVTMQCITSVAIAPRPLRAGEDADAPRREWTRLTLCPKYGMGPIWLTEVAPNRTIERDCTLSLDKRGRFYLNVPYAIEPTPSTAKPLAQRKTGTVDAGDRVRATVYCPDDGEVVQYAVGRCEPGCPSKTQLRKKKTRGGGKDRIFRECERLDHAISLAKTHAPERRPNAAQRAALKERVDALKRRREGADVAARRQVRREINALVAAEYRRKDGAPADTPSQRRARLVRIARHRANVQHLVREARNKIALDLVRRYDTLVLPPFETGGMVKKNQARGGRRNLHSKVARSLMSWSCYEFRIHVKRLLLRHGKEVVEMGEQYTTMCCGCCGVLNEKHSNEEWTCKHCGAHHLRDPAAARCIFLKSLAAPPQAQPPEPTSHGEIQPTNISTLMLAAADAEVARSGDGTSQ